MRKNQTLTSFCPNGTGKMNWRQEEKTKKIHIKFIPILYFLIYWMWWNGKNRSIRIFHMENFTVLNSHWFLLIFPFSFYFIFLLFLFGFLFSLVIFLFIIFIQFIYVIRTYVYIRFELIVSIFFLFSRSKEYVCRLSLG